MTGRELDLYDGVESRPPTAAGATTAPARAPSGRAADWIAVLWSRFPEAVRARFVPRAAIGEGGMGVVLEADDQLLDRVVAVKGVRDPLAIGAHERARMAREARLAARLTHPNVLPVYDTWEDADHNPWCAMLRVPASAPGGLAPTLATRLDALAHVRDVAARPLAELCGLFLQVCRGVAHAHEHGIVHRDLKPANVLLGPSGEALVADWGVAQDSRHPEPAEVVGTPGYAAPEQLGLGGEVTAGPRSDVYSLGVILAEILGAHRRAPGDPLVLPARAPRELASIVARATAREPAERFDGVPALQAAVEAYLAGGLVEGLAYTPGERARKWAARHPGRAMGLAGACALALFAVYGLQRENANSARAESELFAQVARMHAKAAESELAAGRHDEARVHATRAVEASLAAPPEFSLSAKRAWSAFVNTRTAGPLAWAARLPEPPSNLTFSASGDALLVATRQPSLFRVPLSDTRRLERIPFHRPDTFNALGDPTGRWFAAGTIPGDFTLFDVSKRSPVALPPSVGRAWTALFGPESRTLLLAGARWVHHVDLATLRETSRAGPFDNEIWGMTLSPDGQLAAVAERGRDVRVFRTASGQLVTRIATAGMVLGMAFSPDGTRLYTGGNDAVMRRWDLPSGRLAATFGEQPTNVLSLELSPDGRLVASTSQDNLLRLWDADRGTLLATLAGHTKWVWSTAFSPDGRYLATSSDDGSVRLWDVAEAVRPRLSGRAVAVTAFAFAPSGTRLAIAHQDRTVRVVGADGREHARGAAPAPLAAVALSATGRLTGLALAPDAAAARVHSTTAPAQAWATLAELPVRGAGALLALSADGGTAAALGPAGAPVAVRVATGAASAVSVPALPLSTHLTALALSPDGTLLAAGDAAGSIAWVHLGSGRTWPARRIAGSRVNALAFTADGRSVAAAAETSGRVALHDVESGTGRVLATPHLAPVRAIAVTRDLRYVVSGAPDGLRLVRPNGTRSRALELEDIHVNGVAVSPDGRLAAWSSDADVHVWDLAVPDDPRARVREILASSFFMVGPEDELVPRPPAEAPRARWTPH